MNPRGTIPSGPGSPGQGADTAGVTGKISASDVTTHVLDTARGVPAAGVQVRLEVLDVDGSAAVIGQALTDEDGRAHQLGPAQLPAGRYRLVFDTAGYHASQGQQPFFPEVTVTFRLDGSEPHCHVPLLLSPFAYVTYRGS